LEYKKPRTVDPIARIKQCIKVRLLQWRLLVFEILGFLSYIARNAVVSIVFNTYYSTCFVFLILFSS